MGKQLVVYPVHRVEQQQEAETAIGHLHLSEKGHTSSEVDIDKFDGIVIDR